jgi:3-hydroxyacyl-CoA dehydrogenase/enoyl-CoA hydratase/3-hydroxybutyryl-CoA epimerase
MTYKLFTLNKADDGITEIVINNQSAAVNVIDWEFNDEFKQILDDIKADESVVGVIVTSAKPSFVAGADLSIMEDFIKPGITPTQAAQMIGRIGDTLRQLEQLGKPVVGASTGTALGGGLEILLACHYRIAADNPSAKYGLPEVGLGLLPGAGGTQRLPRIIGIVKALPMLQEGRPISTQYALKLKIINEIVSPDQLMDAAHKAILEKRVPSAQPWDIKGYKMPGGDSFTISMDSVFAAANAKALSKVGGNLPAPKAILSCVYEGSAIPIDKALNIEKMYFAKLVQGKESQNLIQIQFYARQAADKLIARPAGIPATKVQKLGIVGTGFMGQGIAQVAAEVGIAVVMLDRELSIAKTAIEAIEKNWVLAVEKGSLKPEAAIKMGSNLTASGDINELLNCDLIIEAIVEDLEVKHKLLAQLNALDMPNCILASNTSTLPIGELAKATSRPEMVVGLHFFSPVSKMALVEVIKSSSTSDETLARSLDFVRQIQKTPIVVNDAYAFYTTRCVEAFIREGIRMLAEGIDPAMIENAAITLGMPVGPLTLCDEVGLDVIRHIQKGALAFSGEAYERDHSDDLIEKLFIDKRYGRKSGGGIFDYSNPLKSVWKGLPITAPSLEINTTDIESRLLAIQLLAAASAWDRGIVDDPAQADLGAVLGWAFPVQLGGPFREIENQGVEQFVKSADVLATKYGKRFAPPIFLKEMAQKGEVFNKK